MPVETRWVAHGEPALVALESTLSRARADDPLGPITVVTPSPLVAVATRREVARRLGGLVGVGFHGLGALAEMIAAPRLASSGIDVGVDRELVVAGVRAVLEDRPGRLAPIADHRATWEAVAVAVSDLAGLTDDQRSRVAAGGDLPAEMARLYAAVTDLVGSVVPTAVLRVATELVISGAAHLEGIGTVIVHLPEQLTPAEIDLLGALGEEGQVQVVLGTAGRVGDDAQVAARLAPLGVHPPHPDDSPSPAVPTAVVSANDIDDEVRAAVRRLLAVAEGGTPLHRMALVHPGGAPYARVVADVLGATGVPFSGPSTRTLAQTAPGRVLRGLLSVIRSRFARQAVVDLWATGVVVDADGRAVPSATFDEISRSLGVVRGVERWKAALDTSDERLRGRLDDADDLDEGLQRWVDDQLAANDRLRRSLLGLEQLSLTAPAAWRDVAAWCSGGLELLCGPRTRRSWPDHELDADVAIRTALGRLVALERVEEAPGSEVVFDTIETVLDAPAPRATRTGSGLLVTTIDRPPLLPLDAVAVVGLVEGQAPHVPADDVLLGDDLRVAVGLPGSEDRQRAQRRAFEATLASATGLRLLTFARHDQRSGRTLVPSRWVVDAIERRSGARPDAEALMSGADVEGVELVESYSAGLQSVAVGAVAALHREERTFASLVEAGGLDGHPAAAEETIAAGAALVRARQSHEFTRFDGNLDGDGVDVSEMAVLSPTSLETYASCPRRWFFTHALKVRTTDRPEEIDRLEAREKGTLVHRVLERFFAEMIGTGTVPAPGRPWPPAAGRRLAAIAQEEYVVLEDRGLTGHPRWWDHDRAEIDIALRRALERDVEVRAELGTMPIAVEFSFGRHGAPPLEVDLGDGRTIALAGSADRVDIGDGVVEVWDYKYSGSTSFESLVKPRDKGGDPLAAGTRLQLVAYGMAAAEAYAESTVHAAYWFLRPDANKSTIGYAVTDDLRDRFRRVLEVLADGIGEGRFPARPGEFRWHLGTHAHCSWCDFDSICPRDRDEEWERVRFDPSLEHLGRLVDEGSDSVLGAGPTAAGGGAR